LNYEDEFSIFYEKKFPFLFDYNEQLLQFILKSLKLKIEIKYTDSYEANYPDLVDLRTSINPKKETDFDQKTYFQVFEDRKGFIKNLSIIDLLFNQGPNSLHYL